MISLLAVLCLVLSFSPGEAGDKCMECIDTPHPSDCGTITVCGSNEKCFVRQFVSSGGILLYNTGCLSTTRCSIGKRETGSALQRRQNGDVDLCIECCDGDFCNVNGCGQTVQNINLRGPYCYTCEHLATPELCRDVKMCSDAEVCITQEYVHSGIKKFRSGCERKVTCDALSAALIGRRDTTCHKCCDTDFCNDDCHISIGSRSTQPPVMTSKIPTDPPTTTRAPSTTSSTTSTSTTLTTTVKSTTLSTTSSSSSAPTPSREQQCRQNGYSFIVGFNLCFKIHDEIQTWDHANQTCGAEGGRLIVLDTDSKFQFIRSILQTSSSLGRFWIGAKRPYADHLYRWISNWHPVKHYVFGHSALDHTDGIGCLLLVGFDGFHATDDNCWKNFKFICEKAE